MKNLSDDIIDIPDGIYDGWWSDFIITIKHSYKKYLDIKTNIQAESQGFDVKIRIFNKRIFEVL
jgi:hypothetical protein